MSTNTLFAFLVHVEVPEFCGGGHREVHVLAVGVEAAKVEAAARIVQEFGEAARGWQVVACVRATGAVVRQGVSVPKPLSGIGRAVGGVGGGAPLVKLGPGGDFVREYGPEPVRVDLPRVRCSGWDGFWSAVGKAVGHG